MHRSLRIDSDTPVSSFVLPAHIHFKQIGYLYMGTLFLLHKCTGINVLILYEIRGLQPVVSFPCAPYHKHAYAPAAERNLHACY